MTDDTLRELLLFRLEQAHESLREADVLCAAQANRGAVNRAYYAMFYALLALLATKQLGTSKHSGAISLFDREFVKTGVFPRELSRSLHLAFDQRQTYDYGEMVEIEPDASDDTIASARSFVASVEQYLREQGLL